MEKTKEQLQNDVSSIQQKVENLKKLDDELKKQQQLEKVKQEISTLRQEIENSVLEEAEKKVLLDSLTIFSSELITLKNEILGNDIEKQKEEKTEEKDEKKKDERGFFRKIGDNAVALWNDGRGTRAKMGLAIGAVGYGIVKIVKMFKKREGKEKEEYEKKGFFGKTWSNVKKYAVGPLAFLVGGKWLYNKLLSDENPTIDANARSDAEEQVRDAEALKQENPEKFAKYQGLGENIDVVYEQAMQKEIDAGLNKDEISIKQGYDKYVDKSKLTESEFKAVVPFCVDNEFGSVDKLLSEHGYYRYVRGKNVEEWKQIIKGWGKEKIAKFVGPWLSNHLSWIPFAKKGVDNAVEKWLDANPTEGVQALNMFFRQYTKVIHYMQDRRSCLKEQIAEEKFQKGGKHTTLEDALDDEVWMEQYVYSDSTYKSFMSGKIHNAVDIMKERNIFNAELSMGVQKIVAAHDGERDRMLYYDKNTKQDALGRLQAGIDAGSLTQEHWKEGEKICKNVIHDIDHTFDESFTYMIASGLHTAINTKENNIQEFLKNSGLHAMKNDLKNTIEAAQEEFRTGSITSKSALELKDTLNSYFAMKKEIYIAAKALQDMKADGSSATERILQTIWATTQDLGGQLKNSVDHFSKGWKKGWSWGGAGEMTLAWAWLTGPLLVTGAGLKIFGKGKWSTLGTKLIRANIFTNAYYLSGNISRRFNSAKFMDPFFLKKIRYNVSHGDQLLLQDIIQGKIYGNRIESVLKGSPNVWSTASGGKIQTIENFVVHMWPQAPVDTQKAMKVLCVNEGGINLLENSTLRKTLFHEIDTGWVDGIGQQVKRLRTGYKEVGYSFNTGAVDFINGDEFKNLLALSEEQKNLFKGLKFSSLDDAKNVAKNIKSLDLSGLDHIKISQLAETLSKEMSAFGDMSKLNGIVDGVRKGSTVEHFLPNHSIVNTLNKDLRSLEEQAEILMKSGKSKTVRFQSIEQDIKYIDMFKKELKNIPSSQLDELEILWKEIRALHTNEGVATNFLKNVQEIVGHRNFEKVAENFDWKNLRKYQRDLSLSDEVIESVSKLVKQIENKGLAKLMANGWKALKQGFKTLVNVLRKIHIR